MKNEFLREQRHSLCKKYSMISLLNSVTLQSKFQIHIITKCIICKQTGNCRVNSLMYH